MLGLRTLRTPALRRTTALQLGARRWTSGIGEKGFEGAADNAFNRERAAVKEHAAASSGTSMHTHEDTPHTALTLVL